MGRERRSQILESGGLPVRAVRRRRRIKETVHFK
jgi:hypothetical protein